MAQINHPDTFSSLTANRIIASTLRRLLARQDIDAEIHDRIASTCYRLSQIVDIPVTDHVFRAVQLHRNNRPYRLLMDICRIIHRAGLTREDQGEFTFRDFIRDERQMRRLFERFVRNFIRYEVEWLSLEPAEIQWRDLRGSPEAISKVPRMRTDIRARGKTRRLIIDTKFVPQVFHFGLGGKATIRSPHLYQLHAYVSNLAHASNLPVFGMLLYPAVESRQDLKFSINEGIYRVATLDLNQSWHRVRTDLMELLREEC